MDVGTAMNKFYYNMTLNELKLMHKNELYPNITYNSLLYLDLIDYKKNCTISFLAEALKISKSAVTIKVNELIKQGFVEKTQSTVDKRINYLTIDPAVAEDFKSYDMNMFKAVKKIENSYSKEEIDVFCKMLEMLSESYLESDNG